MIFEMPNCGGCRTCEIACSYHHAGIFQPSISSIQIVDKQSIGGYEVWLAEKDYGERAACDGCKDLKTPVCVEYCKEAQTLEGIIKDFLGRR